MGRLYENIQSLCRKKGIRPGKMCDELCISRGLITDLKMGRKKGISAGTAHKIAEYFGVSIASLMGDTALESGDAVFESFYGDYLKLTDEDRQTVWDLMRLLQQRHSRPE